MAEEEASTATAAGATNPNDAVVAATATIAEEPPQKKRKTDVDEHHSASFSTTEDEDDHEEKETASSTSVNGITEDIDMDNEGLRTPPPLSGAHMTIPPVSPIETLASSPPASTASSRIDPLIMYVRIPALLDHDMHSSEAERDAFGQEWCFNWYPRGHQMKDDSVSVSIEMMLPSVVPNDFVMPTRTSSIEIRLLQRTMEETNQWMHYCPAYTFGLTQAEYIVGPFISRSDLLNAEHRLVTSDGYVDVQVRLDFLQDSINTFLIDSTTAASATVATSSHADHLMTEQSTAQDATAMLNETHHDLTLPYDSKRETGMVGLKNQGATCYMNSLLQTLFHLRAFRQVVYDTPTEQEDTTDSVTLALQRVFYRLQTQSKAVSTKELTRSFGWSQIDSFMQHDVQELYRILCDRLEEKMKNTTVDGTIKKLFEGKVQSFVQCINVDFQSSRDESFYDLQLDVKGCNDIYASFRKYVEIELLQEENQYDAEGHGKQDAKKGVRFLHFPPVLNIQLKRFEYDPMRDGMVKIHDRFEFPKTLVLDEFYAPNAEKPQESHVYHLHSVLVHSGDVHGGHYYVYIRPGQNIAQSNDWFKFDDDQISRVDEQTAIEESFGSVKASCPSPSKEESAATALDLTMTTPEDDRTDGLDYGRSLSGSLMPLGHRSFSSAYMLVYVRDGENDIRCIQDQPAANNTAPQETATTNQPPSMDLVNDLTIPESLLHRFHDEEKASAKRKKQQQTEHLYMNLRIATDSSIAKLKKYTKNVDFSAFTSNACIRIRIKRTHKIRQLYQRIYAETGVPVDRQRLWRVITRENRTTRPDQPLEADTFDYSVDSLIDEDASSKSAVKLYLQILADPEGRRKQSQKHVVNRYFLSDFIAPETEKREDTEAKEDDNEANGDVVMQDVSTPAPAIDIPLVNPHEILLFIKFYDVKKKLGERLEYVGNILIDSRKTGADLACFLSDALGIPLTNELILYEEIQPTSVSEIELEVSLDAAEIQHGDIICYQYAADEQEATANAPIEKYPDVPSYFRYLLDRVDVVFMQLGSSDESFTLHLLYSNVYEDIIDAVATQLDMVDKRLYLRLYQHSPLNGLPKKAPLRHAKYAGDKQTTLEEFLTEYTERTNILYYEILANPITEIESKRQVLVYFSIYDACFVDPNNPRTPRSIEFLVERTDTMADLLLRIQQTFELDESTASRLRVCEVSQNGTILHNALDVMEALLETYFSPLSGLSSPSDLHLFVEVIPEDEVRVRQWIHDCDEQAEDGLMELGVSHFVFHSFGQHTILPHGCPMMVYYHTDDMVSDIKRRIQTRMNVADDVFASWKLSFIRDNRASTMEQVYEDMTPEEIDVLTMERLEEVCGAEFSGITCFGLEHDDETKSLVATTPKYSRRQEQGIRIRQN